MIVAYNHRAFTLAFDRDRTGERGIALVIMLAFLVLISALTVSFFSNTQTELRSAKSYSAGVTVKQLSDAATNIVMAQIVDATKSFEIPRDTSDPASEPQGKRLTWSSQPGLIRTWRADLQKPVGRSFKLYSAKNMVIPAGDAPYNVVGDSEDDLVTKWFEQPAHYVDLNSPVLVSDTQGKISVDGKLFTANYPILDPLSQSASPGPGSVEGFVIRKPPGYDSDPAAFRENSDPTKPRGASTANPAPMPVLWLYVLRDGTITAPTPDSKATHIASWSNLPDGHAKKPSANNPIVGRIAFWTDDESCKVNLNTAAEGVFWDRPWAEGSQERNYARDIPAQNEFQRYAGHPAMTCLSAVFGKLPGLGVTNGFPTWAQVSPYYDFLTPRVANGGTRAGTTPATQAIPLENDRLFASVDELLFRVNADPQLRQPITSASPLVGNLNRTALERTKFFLTTSSRAPEVNLFNKPRLCLWPLQANIRLNVNPQSQQSGVARPEQSPWRNAKDRLIAFCTSTQDADGVTKPYYFQRYSVYDRARDGRGSPQNPPPSCYHWELDFSAAASGTPIGIPRNVELYKYLQDLTEDQIPGVGTTFFAKYGSGDRNQIVTSMFDTIRSGVNSYSTGLPIPGDSRGYDYAPSRGSPRPGETQVVPFKHANDTKGFGRFATITEAALVFYCSKGADVSGRFVPDEMKAFLILEPFNPSIGPASWSHHVRFRIRGLNRLRIQTENGPVEQLDFPAAAENLITSRVGYSGGGHTTAFMGLQSFFRFWRDGGRDQNKSFGPGNAETNYQFVTSRPVRVAGKSFFDFLGGPSGVDPLIIEIRTGYPGMDLKVQEVQLRFPSVSRLAIPNDRATDLRARIQGSGDISAMTDYRTELIRPGDVVRSVEANTTGEHGGDLRFFCARLAIPETYFSPAVDSRVYGQGSNRIVHSLRQTCWADEQFYADYVGPTGATIRRRLRTSETGGKLVSAVTYQNEVTPAVPRGLDGANGPDGPGDWDNGVGYLEDGPYVNKPDEGNIATGEGSYFGRGSFNVETGITYSPNRQVSSAVMFGSLPTGIYSNPKRPWQTLCFTAHPAAGKNHRGLRMKPADHLFLDFFTMPIVEPYAISEPFSTAGKVNLNYQIAPFHYIRRDTALRAVLKSTLITAIPNNAGQTYKKEHVGGSFRKALNLEETMKGFERRLFSTNAVEHRPFFSASEICEMSLVPVGATLPNIDTFWSQHQLTGDNAREYPYGHIYPRVTTKSNVFTVHVRVQTLQKLPGRWEVWDESRDQVLAEHRGSTIIERYVDASAPPPTDEGRRRNMPDFAKDDKATLDEFYKFRIVSTRKFAP